MAETGSDQERTEAPTQRRLERAFDEGTIQQPQDFYFLAALCLAAVLAGPAVARAQKVHQLKLCQQAHWLFYDAARGVQLRVSPLLGVSGPLSDMAAYGTPAVANRGLCQDVDTPDFIDRLPDEVSPVMVAEAIERRLAHPWDPEAIERSRREYLEMKSPASYAMQLYGILSAISAEMASEGE